MNYPKIHIRITAAVVVIVFCAYVGICMLLTGWSYFLAMVCALLTVAIAGWLIQSVNETNRQTAAFFHSLRNLDLTQRFPQEAKDPVLGHLYAEMNQITALFASNRRAQEEKQLYYESIIRVLTHEIRNSVTPISSLSADMLAHAAVSSPEEIKDGLEVIHRQADDLSEFLDSYHRLTHLPDPEVKMVVVKEIFTKLSRLLCAEPGHACVHYDMPETMTLKVDPNLLVLALINLIRNALQAIGGQEDGWVRVEGGIDTGSSFIKVTDNGSGIPAQWLDAVFTPFFSTKAEGSGIGLSLSRRIMQLHNGTLTVESEPGGHTLFTMRFPHKA